MSFETPQEDANPPIEIENSSNHEPVLNDDVERLLGEMEVSSDGERIKPSSVTALKKYIMLSVLGLAPFLVSGCSDKAPERNEKDVVNHKAVNSERSTVNHEQQTRNEVRLSVLNNQREIMNGSFDFVTNKFLQYYNEHVGKSTLSLEKMSFDEGKIMRKLQIAEKHGINVRNFGPSQKLQLLDIFCPHGIPVIFELNGQVVNVAREDLSDHEVSVLTGYYNAFHNDKSLSTNIGSLTKLGIGDGAPGVRVVPDSHNKVDDFADF